MNVAETYETAHRESGMRYHLRSIAFAAAAPCPSTGSCEAMSLRSRLSLALRPRRTPWRWTAASIALLLSACSPAADATATPSQPALGLPASSSGVCEAIGALPDPAAAKRAFTNLAHQALHDLAADPRLDRSTSARVLEAMEKVEADFSRSSDVAMLTDDLTRLHSSADVALRALGVAVPACAQ